MSNNRELDRYMDAYLLLNHWVEALHLGHSIRDSFEDFDYKEIAIYGMGDLSNRIVEELDNSDIQIVCGIDRDVAGTVSRLDRILSLSDEIPELDAIIVTPFYQFEKIKADLREKTRCPIISIEEVIWSI